MSKKLGMYASRGGYVGQELPEICLDGAIYTESQLRAALSGVDRLPHGHTVLEQAECDASGRVSQTVRIDATGEEYERIVSGEEAYGAEE